MSRLALGLLLATSMIATAGCAAEHAAPSDDGSSSEDALVAVADDEWFYAGPLPALQQAHVTTSLKGHTAHVTGFVDASVVLPSLPHVRTKPAGTRTQVDVVYPIATAGPGHSNSSPGVYGFYEAKPYRPDGAAYTPELGVHQVPWGGFPFLGYNNGIAFHGPITSELGKTGDNTVWFLRRGAISSGCNRMNGEHVVELTHLLGISMRKTYGANQSYPNPTAAKVTVLADYDTLDGKYIDVDYATDDGVVRPGKVYGDDKVVMFGSWVATVLPDGKDLPPDMIWEGGVNGKPYVFADHARTDMVCSFAKRDLPGVKTLVREMGGELPRNVCEKKQCIVDAIRGNTDPKGCLQ